MLYYACASSKIHTIQNTVSTYRAQPFSNEETQFAILEAKHYITLSMCEEMVAGRSVDYNRRNGVNDSHKTNYIMIPLILF